VPAKLGLERLADLIVLELLGLAGEFRRKAVERGPAQVPAFDGGAGSAELALASTAKSAPASICARISESFSRTVASSWISVVFSRMWRRVRLLDDLRVGDRARVI